MKKVTWTMRKKDSDLLHETLVMDSRSTAFMPELRRCIRDALERLEIDKPAREAKSKKQVRRKIAEIKQSYAHVLEGSVATIGINAPRALMQIAAESRLSVLHWVLGTEYKSTLKGTNT